MEDTCLDDQMPYQFFLHMQCLSGTTALEPLMGSQWLRRLPSALQLIIATMDGQSLQTAADVADKVYATLPSSIAETASLLLPAGTSLTQLHQQRNYRR